jgi:hypothetical protein
LANSHNFSRSQLRCNLFWFITPHQVRAGCSPLSTHLAHILKWPSYWYVFSHRPRTFWLWGLCLLPYCVFCCSVDWPTILQREMAIVQGENMATSIWVVLKEWMTVEKDLGRLFSLLYGDLEGTWIVSSIQLQVIFHDGFTH